MVRSAFCDEVTIISGSVCHLCRVAMPPRRVWSLFLVVGVLVTTVLVLTPSVREAVPVPGAPLPVRFTGKIPSFKVPDFHFSFRTASHKPPEQRNSTSGDSSWYSDWKWLNPFSSSITLDENRSVLPPLSVRPPIYTYYDAKTATDEKTRKVDQDLLLTWRRAWWAHGFYPVILSQAEALNNPLYQSLQGKGLPRVLEFEFFRWLAWGHMGGGLLSSWHCVPMGSYDDELLSHLRRGQYPELTRFEGLGAGLFAGAKTHIDNAIKDALLNLKLNTFKSITEAIPADRFLIDQPTTLAYYDSATIKSKYPLLAQMLDEDPAKGRSALSELIVAHLHTIWQNTFSGGIAVLKPLPAHMSAVIAPSLDLANMLGQCPESLIMSSCPPNKPKCSPCVASRMRITTPPTFRNTSNVYTIGTVLHPYTLITLQNGTDSISISHIRRYTERDLWLMTVTIDILGSGRGSPSRLIGIKDAVASGYAVGRSLWLAVEQLPTSLNKPPPAPKLSNANPDPVTTSLPDEWLEILDWHFGFPIPRQTIQHGESIPPVPGPERWPKGIPGLPVEKKKSWDPDPPTEKQMATEAELLMKARDVVSSKDPRIGRIKEVAEAWNLADTEAWKFVRAYRARTVVERLKWEEEEKAFLNNGAGKGKGRWWRM
jgi:hypothetical protein